MSWAEIKKSINSNLDIPLNELIGGNNVGNRVISYDSGKMDVANVNNNQTLLSISNNKGGFLRNLSVFFNSYYSGSSTPNVSGNAMLTVQISVDGSLFKTYRIMTNNAAGRVRYSMAINLSNNKDLKQSYMAAVQYSSGNMTRPAAGVPYVNNFGKFYTGLTDNKIDNYSLPELIGDFRCRDNDVYDNSSYDISLASGSYASNLNVLFENPIFFKESITVSIKAYDVYNQNRAFRFAGKVNYNIL